MTSVPVPYHLASLARPVRMESAMTNLALYNLSRAHNVMDQLAGKRQWDAADTRSFDTMHYLDDAAIEHAVRQLGMRRGQRVLNIGAGFGAVDRYLARKYNARVVGVERQSVIHDMATVIALRNGPAMSRRVASTYRDFATYDMPQDLARLRVAADEDEEEAEEENKSREDSKSREHSKSKEGEKEEKPSSSGSETAQGATPMPRRTPTSTPRPLPFDHILSFLGIMHTPDRARLFGNAAAALRPGGRMYVEDYFASGYDNDMPSAWAAKLLRDVVKCPYLPGRQRYVQDLEGAGFEVLDFEDVTGEWRDFARKCRSEYERDPPGGRVDPALSIFFRALDELFRSGQLGGCRITSRKREDAGRPRTS